jgi:3-dehydroquinate synthetase
MILNFGHTFAHAIEAKSKYSQKSSHGEAVLSGMILETKLSVIRKICQPKTFSQIKNIYLKNNLTYTYKNYSKKGSISKLIPYLKNDKKNNDEKVNFILINRIGKTTMPNKHKVSIIELKKYIKYLTQY